MAAAGLIGGLVFGVIGTVMQVAAAQKAAKAQKAALAAQQRAETIRERAMEIDATRRRREQIRQGIIQRAQAQSAAVQQGAEHGTALPGAYSQIAGQTNYAVQGINSQETLGHELFATNRQVLQARKDEADAGAQSALGAGISSLGGAFGRSMGSLGRLAG